MLAHTAPLLLIVWGAVDLSQWETIREQDGVIVSVMHNPGRFPSLKGEGVLPGTIEEVLAVFVHVERHNQWMPNCTESRILERQGEFGITLYHRVHAPWPVSDRDAVIRTSLWWDRQKGEARIDFWEVPNTIAVKGVVRMTGVRGSYTLIRVDAERTYLIYRIDADPGGILPQWAAMIAQRDLPLYTVLNLRRELKEFRNVYPEVARYRDPGFQWEGPVRGPLSGTP